MQAVDVPPLFTCPISLSLMQDPVTLPSGITYDRASIEKWLDDGNLTCPFTMTVVGPDPDLIPNHALRRMIQDWSVANRSKGVERVATPTPPAEPRAVRAMLQEVRAGAAGSNVPGPSLQALRSLRGISKKSERNRRCVREAGATEVLAEAAAGYYASIAAASSRDDHRQLLRCDDDPESSDQRREEAIEALQECVAVMALLELEDAAPMAQSRLVAALSWLLNRACSIDARVNAALVLRRLAYNEATRRLISPSRDVITGLTSLLREPLYPVATKAALRTLFALYHEPQHAVRALARHQEAIHALIELLPGASTHTTERILALLYSVSACADGRALIRGHALAVPSLVRSLLVVSELADQHAISILWSICVHTCDDDCIEAASHLGVTQSLLLLAQMDIPQPIKQKTKDLLKTFAPIDCVNASGTSLRI